MNIKLPEFKEPIAVVIDKLTEQIISWFTEAKVVGGVIGLSNGIDSTVVAYLCAEAVRKYPLFEIHGLIMPSDSNSKNGDTISARRLAVDLKMNWEVLHINGLVNAFDGYLNISDSEYHIGNLSSEIRAVLLSRFAAKKNLLVMGTGNKDEDYVLGYFTKRGDGAVDNNILGGLSKRLVYKLAEYLRVPDEIIKKKPTAGLWKGQTDEGELGFTYAFAEKVLCAFEQGMNSRDICVTLGCGMRDIAKVLLRHKNTKHKRQLPPIGEFDYVLR